MAAVWLPVYRLCYWSGVSRWLLDSCVSKVNNLVSRFNKTTRSLKRLSVTICNNLHVLIPFLLAICVQIVTRCQTETFPVSLCCLHKWTICLCCCWTVDFCVKDSGWISHLTSKDVIFARSRLSAALCSANREQQWLTLVKKLTQDWNLGHLGETQMDKPRLSGSLYLHLSSFSVSYHPLLTLHLYTHLHFSLHTHKLSSGGSEGLLRVCREIRLQVISNYFDVVIVNWIFELWTKQIGQMTVFNNMTRRWVNNEVILFIRPSYITVLCMKKPAVE